MQIGNKKTTLKDNAALYTHESDGLTEREKFRSLHGRKKWIQFRDYYLLKIIAVVCVLAFVVSLLVTVFSPKPEIAFYAAVSDYVLDYEEIAEMQKEFNEYISLDEEKEETMFDSSFYFLSDEMASMQKYAVYVAVGQISVSIMPQSVYEKLVVNNYFKPLSEALSTELYLKLSDRFVMSATADDKGNLIPDSEKAYGICLDGTRFFPEGKLSEPVILTVCPAWENDAVCSQYIEFLLK